jgi:prevent-host-death family protein
MKVASVADVKAKLSAYLSASREGPVVVTRNGKAVAVLLAVEDDEELERLLLAHSPRLRAILDAGRSRVRAGKGVPHADFWGDAGAAMTHKKPRKPQAKPQAKPPRKAG